jgi:hypothetical protein
MTTVVKIDTTVAPEGDEGIFVPGNLVRYVKDTSVVVMVISSEHDYKGSDLFSGIAIAGSLHDLFDYDYTWDKDSFEQFVGTVTLTGSL